MMMLTDYHEKILNGKIELPAYEYLKAWFAERGLVFPSDNESMVYAQMILLTQIVELLEKRQ